MPVGAKTENGLGGGLVDGRERERGLYVCQTQTWL